MSSTPPPRFQDGGPVISVELLTLRTSPWLQHQLANRTCATKTFPIMPRQIHMICLANQKGSGGRHLRSHQSIVNRTACTTQKSPQLSCQAFQQYLKWPLGEKMVRCFIANPGSRSYNTSMAMMLQQTRDKPGSGCWQQATAGYLGWKLEIYILFVLRTGYEAPVAVLCCKRCGGALWETWKDAAIASSQLHFFFWPNMFPSANLHISLSSHSQQSRLFLRIRSFLVPQFGN